MQMPTKNINPLNDYERGRKHGQWMKWKNLRFHPTMKNVPENHFPRTPYSAIIKFNYEDFPSNLEPPVTLSTDKQMLWRFVELNSTLKFNQTFLYRIEMVQSWYLLIIDICLQLHGRRPCKRLKVVKELLIGFNFEN